MSTTKKATKKKTVAKKTVKTKTANGDGYKGHREGSTKGKVHQMFDKMGDEKARVAVTAKKMCAPSTLNSWFTAIDEHMFSTVFACWPAPLACREAKGSGSSKASPIKLLNRRRKQIVLQLGLDNPPSGD
jgi:hypothetical protein